MEQHGKALAGAHAEQVAPAEPAAAAARRERAGPDRDLRSADGGGQVQAAHRAGGRMAARQFLPDRRADPHRPAAPAEGLQPRAAAPGAGAVARIAARLRHRAGGDLAWRRARRLRDARPLRRGVSIDCSAHAWRVVGDSDHAAPGADRESAPRRCADHGLPIPSESGAATGPTR